MGSSSAQGKELIKNVRSAGDWRPSLLVEGGSYPGKVAAEKWERGEYQGNPL